MTAFLAAHHNQPGALLEVISPTAISSSIQSIISSPAVFNRLK
jgi:hypothetical protein